MSGFYNVTQHGSGHEAKIHKLFKFLKAIKNPYKDNFEVSERIFN